MPPANYFDEDYEDEWYRKDVYGGARHVPKPPREHFGRRTSEFLNPEVHYSSGLHRTKSQGHGVTPNVTIYNTTRMENESSPNVRTTTDQRSREPSADGRGRARRMPGEWGLEDDIEELRLQVTRERLARSHSRGDYHRHHSRSPDRSYEDKLKLRIAEEKLREAEAKIEQERREEEAERREEITRRKLELKYIKDRQEREDEEARIKRAEERLRMDWELKREREEREREGEEARTKRAEERLRMDWDLKREREEREREAKLRDEADKRNRIVAESKAQAEAEARKKKDERERILEQADRDRREADEKRKRLIEEEKAKFEKEQRKREQDAKDKEEEAKRIVAEAAAKREKKEREERAAQQAAVDAYNKRKAAEEKAAQEAREKVIFEYERKKVADKEKAKKEREALLLQIELEKREQEKKDKEEYEAFQRKQEAKKAEEKAKREKEDAALEDAMRKRLAQFGFQENQIQAMVHPAEQKKLEQQQVGLTPHNPLRLAPQPTYAKIRREYLDVETLHYYDIPYESDTDPNYIIVLREMSQRETDILFEHTRRLRSNHGDRLFIEAEGRDRRGKKEYAFVRRKSRSRSRSDVGGRKHVTMADVFLR